MKISVKVKDGNDFKKTRDYLLKLKKKIDSINFEKYADRALQALREATPVRSGKTRDSWYYTIERSGDSVRMSFENSNINEGSNIAILIQYGHGTGTGGYVEGLDYINPALRPVFKKIADDAWKEVIE